MISRTIRMPGHLHARPSAVFAKAARNHESEVMIKAGDRSADGKSPVAILTLGIVKDMQIELLISGPDQEAAMEELSELLQIKLGECADE